MGRFTNRVTGTAADCCHSASELHAPVSMRWVIHYQAPEGWRWQVLTADNKLIAASKTAFQTNAECVISAVSHGYPRAFKPAEDPDGAR
jgi:hypothetical protein